MNRRNNHLLLYLLLNVLVSAGVTLGVLYVWDRTHPHISLEETNAMVQAQLSDVTASPAAPETQITPPPPGAKVITIDSVIGAGDVSQEVVTLKRVGAGDLKMAGWQLKTSRGETYTFPATPELVLYKDGAVQIFSRPGTDTAAQVFWNRSAPAFQSGDTLLLQDPQGVEQASYTVP